MACALTVKAAYGVQGELRLHFQLDFTDHI